MWQSFLTAGDLVEESGILLLQSSEDILLLGRAVCAFGLTKTPWAGRGVFLILEMLNKSWLLTKYTSHLTIARASRQPHHGLENQFRKVPSESLFKRTKAPKSRSWRERRYGPCPAFLSTPFPPSSHLHDHVHCPAHPSNGATIPLDVLFLSECKLNSQEGWSGRVARCSK